MDLNQYVQDAIRTESKVEDVVTDRRLLVSMLKTFIASGTVLDMIKKNVFYDKELDRDVFNNCLLTIIRTGIETKMFDDVTVDGKQYTSPPENLYQNSRVFHSLIGIITESSEIAEALLKGIVGDGVDITNVLEEFGDIAWYEAIGIDECSKYGEASFEDILNTNIEKLRKRYPEKFTSDNAINRDLNIERKTLEDGLE